MLQYKTNIRSSNTVGTLRGKLVPIQGFEAF